MAHPVAHEGNPRFDDIIITGGSVLSVASLEIEIPGPMQSAPLFAPPSPEPGVPCSFASELRAVTGCSDASIIDAYDVGSYFPVNKLNGSFANCGAQGSVTFFITSPRFNFEIVSSTDSLTPTHNVKGNFAGFTLFRGIPSASHSTAENEVSGIYTLVSDVPRTGFCFFVDSTSTPCDFTGMVAIIDQKAGITFIGYYIHADLHSDAPTQVGSAGALPLSGEGVYLFACSGCAPSTSDVQFYSDSVFPNIDIPTLAGVVPEIITPTQSMGIIWLPNTDTGEHRANWEYSFADWTAI